MILPRPLRFVSVLVGLLLLACVFLVPGPVEAQLALDAERKWLLYGDVRFRYEADWDSQRSDGSERADRNRVRVRARVGGAYRPTDWLELGARLRTGRRTAQQSPHLSLWQSDGQPVEPKQVVLDRWLVRLGSNRVTTLAGRQSDPFWKQNELFWNDDVSLTGLTGAWSWSRGSHGVDLFGGVYALPDGMTEWAGNLYAAQLVYVRKSDRVGSTLTTGLFAIDGAQETEYLRNGNGERDYSIWRSSAQARLPTALPVVLGIDLAANFESYSAEDPDPYTAAHHDQTLAYVASVGLGRFDDAGDWLVAYYYARIEALAINASFAQDNWLRWGTNGQTDSSDFSGHELRFAYVLSPRANVVTRLYLVQGIVSPQDGKRFRVDFNARF